MKMKIVVLDGYSLNPGDLSWGKLEKFGDVTIYDRTPPEKILERAFGATVLYTNKTPIDAQTISKLPELKFIGVLATGFNIVDIEAAKSRGIIVTNIPDYGTKSVAQMTFALLLELCHNVGKHSEAVWKNAWAHSSDFCFWNYPLVELQGKTIGIIGFGRIGQAVADIAVAFGMNILGYSLHESDQSKRENFKWEQLSNVLENSDVVSLHCPLCKETEGIINRTTIRKMKKSAFLINTSRGSLVVEKDLADALNNDEIAGAGLDVLGEEPPTLYNPLFSAKNCIITPHIAWATKEARERLMNTAVDNLKEYINENCINVVSI